MEKPNVNNAKHIFKEEEKHQVLKETNVRLKKTSFSVYQKIKCEDCRKAFENLDMQEKLIEEYDTESQIHI